MEVNNVPQKVIPPSSVILPVISSPKDHKDSVAGAYAQKEDAITKTVTAPPDFQKYETTTNKQSSNSQNVDSSSGCSIL